MPSRRSLEFRDFDAAVNDIENLHARGYEKAGTWDLTYMSDHLSLAMEKSLRGWSKPAPWIIRRLLGPMIFRRILKTRSMKQGIQLPTELRPAIQADQEQAVRRCQDLLRQIQKHEGEFQPHAFFGPLTPEETRQLHLIHSAHHLSFLTPK